MWPGYVLCLGILPVGFHCRDRSGRRPPGGLRTINTGMMTFADFQTNQDPELHRIMKDSGLDPDAELTEAFSSGLVKTAAVALLVKIGQLRQNVTQDRMADFSEKSLANMLFHLSSMIAVLIGGIASDADLLNRAKR